PHGAAGPAAGGLRGGACARPRLLPRALIDQNVNRTASCMMRGSPARLEMVPNVAVLLMSRFGRPELVVLNRLNTSRPSVAAYRPPNRIARCALMSNDWNPGPVRRFRSSFPNTPDRTGANAAVLNHWSTVCGPCRLPIWSGRPVMLWPTLLLLWLTVKGRP